MKRFLRSRFFIFFNAFISFVVGIIAGLLLAYRPEVSGKVSGGGYIVSGYTKTNYVFDIRAAFGYWLIALVIAISVTLLCIAIRKLYIQSAENKNEKNN